MRGAVILLSLVESLLECCCLCKAWCAQMYYRALHEFTKFWKCSFPFFALTGNLLYLFLAACPGIIYPFTSHFTVTLWSSIDGNTHESTIVLKHQLFVDEIIAVSQKVLQARFIDCWAQSILSIVLPSSLINPTSLPQHLYSIPLGLPSQPSSFFCSWKMVSIPLILANFF
jgi:hypothetical protein